MKRALVFLCAATLFACNSSDNKTVSQTKTGETKVAAMSTNDLAYPLKNWPDWQRGSTENLKIVLEALKNYENGNVDACLRSFADSVHLAFDEMEGTFSKDSLQKMFVADRKKIKAMKVDMEDYESVKSKDGKYEYVSLWYTEKWQNQKGDWDSVICMDDMKMVNGKIASIDEKNRHFAKKKM